MGQTFWEKWRHRISGAWAVLTGQAFAGYYFDDAMSKYWRPDLSHIPSDLPPIDFQLGNEQPCKH